MQQQQQNQQNQQNQQPLFNASGFGFGQGQNQNWDYTNQNPFGQPTGGSTASSSSSGAMMPLPDFMQQLGQQALAGAAGGEF